MTTLSDTDILRRLERGDLAIDPLDLATQLQPASVDLCLGSDFIVWEAPHSNAIVSGAGVIDMRDVPGASMMRRVTDDRFVIWPGQFVLGTTRERVRLPLDVAARVEGRSSIGRLGLCVHVTAGFIDPGFDGEITLEIYNFNPRPIRLHAGARVAQLVFSNLETPSPRGYQGKYQGQRGATASRLARDFT